MTAVRPLASDLAPDRATDGYQQETVWGLLARRVDEDAARSFLRSGTEAPLTRGEVAERAQELATALVALGVARGTAVATLSSNCTDAVVVWFALARLGAVEVPLNPALRDERLLHILRTAEVRLCVSDDDHVATLTDVFARSGTTAVWPVVTYDVLRSRVGARSALDAEGPAIAASDPACILFTSGTSGPAKGAVLNQGYFTQHGLWRSQDFGLGVDDVLYSCLPLCHVNAKIVTLMAALSCGAQAVIDPVFSASRFWDRLGAVDATMFTFIGNMAAALLAQTSSPLERAHRGRICYGAPVPAGRFDEFEQRFNTKISCGFGMTEASSVMYNPPGSGRYGSLGRPTGAFDVMLQNEDGTWSTSDDPARGELCLRPRKQNVMMAGYHGDAVATTTAWRDLWFHTGDLVERDGDGYYHLVGRLKDTIRRRGENIASADVEHAAEAINGVRECAAIAVPSSTGEEDIKLVIVLNDDASLTHHEVLDKVSGSLPKFAAPAYVEFVAEVPKTLTGRIEKYKLREQWWNDGTYDVTTRTFLDGAGR
jgi:carnitine-CoA ligase